jgi:hypothetical protein
MVDTFGEGSEQAQVAQKKLLSLQDGINQKTEEYNNKVDAAAATVSALNATVGGLQGALELTGLASEETEKALAKVTAALSIGDAIQNLTEFGPMIKTTFDTIKTSGVAAFQALKGAIGATGIGLLVIALGTIVAYWDDIKEAVSGVSDEQQKLNNQAKENLKLQKEKLNAISSQENILKLQGLSEKEILKLKLKETQATIKKAKIEIESNIKIQKLQVAAAERNKEILKGIIDFVTIPIGAVLKGIDTIGSAVGKNFDLYNKFSGGLAGLLFDPEETKSKGEADLLEANKYIKELENQAAGHQIALNDINKKGNEKKTADNKKTNDQIKKDNEAAIAAQKKAQEDLYRSNLSSRERDLYDLKTKYDQEKAIIEKAGKDASALTELYNKDRAAINKKYDDLNEKARQEYLKRVNELINRNQDEQSISEQEKARQAIIDKYAKEREETLKQYPNNLQLLILLKKNEQAELDNVDKDFELKKAERLKKSHDDILQMVKEQNQALVNAEIELQNQRFNAASAGLDLLQSLAGENEKIANAIFAVQKGLEIARIITDTARGIVAAKAGLAAVPPFLGPIPNPAFVLAAAAAAKQIAGLKIAAAVSIAQIAGASIQRFKKGGASTPSGGAPSPAVTGGGAAPIQPTPSPAVQGQALNAQAINNLGNNAMRAYVLNSDIQNNDQRNAYLQRNARIG